MVAGDVTLRIMRDRAFSSEVKTGSREALFRFYRNGKGFRSGTGRGLPAALLASTALAVMLPATRPARAQDATWLLNPTNGNFNNAANWTPTVPTGTAFFGASNTTALSFGGTGGTEVDGWTFNAGASNYSFSNGNLLVFQGAGINIQGGSAAITNTGLLIFTDATTAGSAVITNTDNGDLHFTATATAGSATISNNGDLEFRDSSTAGSAAITNNSFGFLGFSDTSTAGNAAITNNGELDFDNTSTAGNAAITNGAYLFFRRSSTAGNAAITNNAALEFDDTSTAGNATITNNNFGSLGFVNASTAGNATITNNATLFFSNSSTAGNAAIANNGVLEFNNTSTAGNAAIANNAPGAMVDFSGSTGPAGDGKLTAGSIAGNGTFFLGGNELTVGGNNLSTTVTGVIADGGGFGGSGASLVKTGTGTLTLSGANTYTGGTTISAGTLQVGNGGTSGSIVGNVADNGTLAFNRSDAVSFGGVISGSGALQQNGTGTSILTAANTYTGGTTISAGTLRIGNGGTTGSIVGNVVDNGTLAFNRSDTVSFGGVISGTGALQQHGTGTLT